MKVLKGHLLGDGVGGWGLAGIGLRNTCLLMPWVSCAQHSLGWSLFTPVHVHFFILNHDCCGQCMPIYLFCIKKPELNLNGLRNERRAEKREATHLHFRKVTLTTVGDTL